MIRRLLRDSAFYGIGQVVYVGLPVLMVPVYSRLLAPAEYAVLELVTVAGVLLNFVVPLEIGQGLARHFIETRDPAGKARYASSALCFTLLAYAAFLALALPFAGAIAGLLLDAPALADTMRTGLFAIAATGIFIGLHNQLRWQLTPRPYVAAAATHAAVSTAVALWLLTRHNAGPEGIFLGQVAGAACGGAIAAWFARRSLRLSISPEALAQMLRYSVPLVLSSASIFLLQFVDRFILRQLSEIQTVGVYSVGGRLASAAGLLLIGLNAALTPLIFESYREPQTPAALARIFRTFVGVALPVLVLGSVFARELLGVVAGEAYAGAWVAVPFLATASVVARMYIFAPGLDILKKTHVIMAINVASAVLTVALCYALVPPFGMAGAGAAMLCGASISFGAYMAASQALYPVPHAWGPIAAAAAIAAATVALSALVTASASLGPFAAAGIKLALFAACCGLIGLLQWRRGGPIR